MLQRVCHLIKMKPPANAAGLLFASGATVPADATLGYQTGCLFQHTDGSGGTALYVNEGTYTSCDFNPLDAGSHDGPVTVGAFSSLTAGSGIAISADQSYGAVIYGDDGGLSIGDSVYNFRSRILLTVDQAGATIRAVGAQLKLKDLVDVQTGIYTASQGYLELAGTHVSKTGATLSCFDASLEVGTSLTVDSGGEACGVHVETTGAGSITNNGTCAAILIDNAAGAAEWPCGVYMPGPDVTIGIRVGDFVGSAATTGGVMFGTDMDIYSDGQLSVVEAHGASSGDLTSAYCAKVGRFRHIVNATACAHETYGLMGQVVVKDTTITHLHAGLIGTFEGHTSGVVSTPAYRYGTAGVMARIGGGAAITASTPIAGFSAVLNSADALASGSSVAYAVTNTATAEWDYVLGVTHVGSGAHNGVEIVDGLAGDTGDQGKVGYDALMKVDVGGTTYYIALFDAASVTGEA